MHSPKNRIGTQSSMGPVGFEPFYKVGPVNGENSKTFISHTFRILSIVISIFVILKIYINKNNN